MNNFVTQMLSHKNAGAFGGVAGEMMGQIMGDNYNLNAKDKNNERADFLNTVTTLTSLSAQIVNLDGGIAGSTASNAVENNCLEHGCKSMEQLLKEATMPIIDKVTDTANKIVNVLNPDYATANLSGFGAAVGVGIDQNGQVTGSGGGAIPVKPSANAVIGFKVYDGGSENSNGNTAYSLGGCSVVGVCLNGVVTTNKSIYVEIGVGTPGISASVVATPSIGSSNDRKK